MTCPKRPFPNESAAQSAVYRMRAQGNLGLEIYRCVCGKWHVRKKQFALNGTPGRN